MKSDWNDLIESHTKTFYAQTDLDAELRHNKVCDMLEMRLADGAHILDFGCGGGKLAQTLATEYRHKLEYTGYDPAPIGIDLAKKNAYNFPTTFSTKLEEKEYDAITACFVLCTLPNIESTISKLAKMTRRDGHIVICDPHPDAVGKEFVAFKPELPSSFTDGAPYVTKLNGMEPFVDYWHPKSAYSNALYSAGFGSIEFHEFLSTTSNANWKDEKIQAPYLHICAKKI